MTSIGNSANDIALNRLKFEKETFDTLQIRNALFRSEAAKLDEATVVSTLFNVRLNSEFNKMSDGTIS